MKIKILFFHFFIMLIFLSSQTIQAESGNPKGHLVIIGGMALVQSVMHPFISLAGGRENARILVIPMASPTPEKTGKHHANYFKSQGVKHADYVVFNRNEAMHESILRKLEGKTAIYFSGGSQTQLGNIIVGTKVHQKLLEMYMKGAIIGGTSAGAAIMCAEMLTGGQRFPRTPEARNSTCEVIKKNNVMIRPGLGFIRDVIIDQHFVVMRRQNRLISQALERPNLLGLGIDESTAVIIKPDRTFDVIGKSIVVVYDASNVRNVRTDGYGNLSGHNIIMHVLSAGERFNLNARQVIQ